LRIGGATELELEIRRRLAERTAQILRGAMMKGVLPGGGVALLACQPQLRQMAAQACDSDERSAYQILCRMMEAPARTILENAGCNASVILADIGTAGFGYDVRTERIVDMIQAGIFDSADVLLAAVSRAVSTAALTLTIDVLVHHKKPEVSTTP
jgi:chaperonin GroEL